MAVVRRGKGWAASEREVNPFGQLGWLLQATLGVAVRLVIGIKDLQWNPAVYSVARKKKSQG